LKELFFYPNKYKIRRFRKWFNLFSVGNGATSVVVKARESKDYNNQCAIKKLKFLF
jgi:hypothetical protein